VTENCPKSCRTTYYLYVELPATDSKRVLFETVG
jgi:hypothetical protein